MFNQTVPDQNQPNQPQNLNKTPQQLDPKHAMKSISMNKPPVNTNPIQANKTQNLNQTMKSALSSSPPNKPVTNNTGMNKPLTQQKTNFQTGLHNGTQPQALNKNRQQVNNNLKTKPLNPVTSQVGAQQKSQLNMQQPNISNIPKQPNTTNAIGNSQKSTAPTLHTPQVPKNMNSGSGSGKKVFGFLVIILLFLVAAAGGLVYAVAYDKLSLGMPEIEQQIKNSVMSLPFTPKTASYVIQQGVASSSDLKTAEFDARFTVDLEGFEQELGMIQMPMMDLSKFTLTANGKIDQTDMMAPKLDANLNIMDLFDMDMRMVNTQEVYLKLNKVSELITSATGVSRQDFDQGMNIWVQFADMSSTGFSTNEPEIDTQKIIKKVTEETNEIFTQELTANMTLSEETIDNKPVYHINWKPSGQEIKELVKNYLLLVMDISADMYPEQVSDIREAKQEILDSFEDENADELFMAMRNVNFDVYYTKDNYYMYKSVFDMDVVEPDDSVASSYRTEPQVIKLHMDVNYSNHNQPMQIQAPAEYKTFQEIMMLMYSMNMDNSMQDVDVTTSTKFENLDNENSTVEMTPLDDIDMSDL